MGGGGPKSQTQTSAITWKELLPPWVQAGQRTFLPELMSRYYAGGMSPEEEQLLRGMSIGEVKTATSGAKKALAQRMSASGLSPSSPIYAGELADIEAGGVGGIASAIANLAKLKMGAKETATKNLLTALYTPPPYATAQSGSSSGGK